MAARGVRVRTWVTVAAAGLVAASGLMLEQAVSEPSFGFDLSVPDNVHVAEEPVVAIGPDGVPWVAGTGGPGGSLWRRPSVSWTWEDPPSTGPRDATVFVASDGRLYFAEIRSSGGGTGSPIYLEVTSRLGATWGTETEFEWYDRPWFTEHAGAVYLLATYKPDTAQAKVELRKTTDGGSTWTLVQTIATEGFGYQYAVHDGTFYVPFRKNGALWVATGTDGGGWNSVVIESPFAQHTHVMSAADDAGNFYVAWETGTAVKYKVRRPDESPSWLDAYTVASVGPPPSIGPLGGMFGSPIVGGAEGKVDLAWLQRSAGTHWELRFLQLTAADTGTPVRSEEVTIAEPVKGDFEAAVMADFFTMTATAGGDAVIAVGCYWSGTAAGLPDPSAPCLSDEVVHPLVATQIAGSRIR